VIPPFPNTPLANLSEVTRTNTTVELAPVARTQPPSAGRRITAKITTNTPANNMGTGDDGSVTLTAFPLTTTEQALLVDVTERRYGPMDDSGITRSTLYRVTAHGFVAILAFESNWSFGAARSRVRTCRGPVAPRGSAWRWSVRHAEHRPLSLERNGVRPAVARSVRIAALRDPRAPAAMLLAMIRRSRRRVDRFCDSPGSAWQIAQGGDSADSVCRIRHGHPQGEPGILGHGGSLDDGLRAVEHLGRRACVRDGTHPAPATPTSKRRARKARAAARAGARARADPSTCFSG